MAEERIDSYIDLDSIKGETDEFLKYIQQLEDKFLKLKASKITLDASSTTKEMSAAVAEVNKNLNGYNESLKKVEQSEAKVGEAARKAATAQSEKSAATKKATTDTNTDTAANVKAAQTFIDNANAVKITSSAYNDLIDQLIRNKEASASLAAQRKALTVTYREGAISEDIYRDNLVDIKAQELQLAVATNDLNRALRNATKEQEANEGSADKLRARLNQLLQVYDKLSAADLAGNTGAELKAEINSITADISKLEQGTGRFQRNVGNYSSAVTTLEKGLTEVREQLNKLNAAGNGSAEVIQKLTMQEQLLSNLVEGQAAGFASATAEVKNNEKALQALANAGLRSSKFYQELLQETADLKDNVGDLKAEIKNLGSDTQVLDGLIGSAQLLAGTYAIATEGAQLFGISQEDSAEAMKKSQAIIAILTGLQSIQNALQKESATLLFLNSTASKAAAVATTIYTFATAGATVATKALRVALVATGFGAIIVLVGYLVSKLSDLSEGTNDAAKKTKELAEAYKALNDVIAKQTSAFSEVNDDINRSLKEQLAIAEAMNLPQATLLALKKQLAEQDTKLAKQELANLGLTENAVISLQGNRQRAYEDLLHAQELLVARTQAGDERGIKSAQKLTEEYQLRVDVIDSKLAPGQAALNKLNATALSIQTSQLDIAAEQRSELQKQQQVERIVYEQRSNGASAIADDETKSYAIRIRALKNFQQQQIAIVNSERNEKLIDPSLSTQDKILAERTAQAAIAQIRTDTTKRTSDLLIEQEERLSAARLSISNTYKEKIIRNNQQLIDDEKKGYSVRLDAAYENYLIESQIINDNLKEELKNRKLTVEERKALTIKAADEQQALLINYGSKQLELVQANEQRVTEMIAREQDKRADVIAKGQAEALIALNASFANGDIGITAYETKRAAIEQEFRQKSLADEVKNAFAKVIATKAGTDERLKAEKELAEKTKEYSDEVTNKQIANAKRLNELRKELATEAFETFKSLVNAQFEEEKNALAEEQNANEERNARELELNAASAASEEEKANRVILINARAQAEKESIARRNKQIEIEQARFEKAASIASIIANTASAISKQLTVTPLPVGLPFIAAIGAIGALQLARAIATPIPKYKYGTGKSGHKGGDFIAGDGGKKEPIILPTGEVFLSSDKPTLYPNMPAGTEVLPSIDALDNQMMAIALESLIGKNKISENDMLDAFIKASDRQSARIVDAIHKKKFVTIRNTHAGVIASSQGAANSVSWRLSKTQS